MNSHRTVGELARDSGMTVRALHHYHAIGLLVPAQRSPAGYRLYGPEDLTRLYQIRVLRALGLSLADVRTALDGAADLRQVMTRHRATLRQQAREAQRLVKLLDSALDTLERGVVQAEDLTRIMEAMTMYQRYYSDEQMEKLAQRRKEMGEDAVRAAENAWMDLIAAMEQERVSGTPPGDPRVQELARQWRDLIAQFTGNDEGIRQSLETMYRHEAPELASQGAVGAELLAYVGAAWKATQP